MALYRLAHVGNMRDIVERASYLAGLDERNQPFARLLRMLAEGYQSKAVLSLVNECMNEGQGRWLERQKEKSL